MAKVSLVTIISVVLNLFLGFWLINQYMSDAYFKAYVDGTIGQYYPFIVLTLGVGGGSGLGYLFLTRKHGDGDIIGKIQKSKNFKPGPMSSSTTASPSRQILPAGAPPAPVSKHTVYAVPPLPKTSTPSSSRATPGTSWAAGSSKSSLESILSSKQEPTKQPSIPGIQRSESKTPSPFSPGAEAPVPQPLRSTAEVSRIGATWTPQQSSGERRPESGPIFQKPGMDINTRQDLEFSAFSQQPQQGAPVPSKWAPPEDKAGAGQWSEGGVKSTSPVPPKWTPSPSAPGSQSLPQQSFPRPPPPPGRGMVPPQQGGARPFVVQGPGGIPRSDQRPMGPPRPIAAPQPFRPDPNRPIPGIGGQPRPPQPSPRPAAPLAGPMPQPWTPAGPTPEKRETSGPGPSTPSPASVGGEGYAGKQIPEKTGAEIPSSGGGEMDWDTALDTILKTLRKDRVGDTK